jgi:hypothetical protein
MMRPPTRGTTPPAVEVVGEEAAAAVEAVAAMRMNHGSTLTATGTTPRRTKTRTRGTLSSTPRRPSLGQVAGMQVGVAMRVEEGLRLLQVEVGGAPAVARVRQDLAALEAQPVVAGETQVGLAAQGLAVEMKEENNLLRFHLRIHLSSGVAPDPTLSVSRSCNGAFSERVWLRKCLAWDFTGFNRNPKSFDFLASGPRMPRARQVLVAQVRPAQDAWVSVGR